MPNRLFRFYWLDGLRGIAALLVVWLHALDPFSADQLWVPHAALSVDFFFILSGFVIAHSYDQRLANGLSLQNFIHLRLIRLYPMIALGMILGVVVYAIKIVSQNRADLWLPVLGSTLLNAALLPSPWLTADAHGTAWPIDLPLWSLSFELAVNLLYAVLLYKLAGWRLWGAAGLGLLCSIWTVWSSGSIGGPQWDNMGQGWVRVFFPFTAGMLLARWYANERQNSESARPSAAAGPLCMLALVASMTFQVPTSWSGWYGVGVVAGLFPLLVWLAARYEPGQPSKTLTMLGELSYPLYALHYPLVKVCSNAMRRAGINPDHPAFYACVAAELALCVMVAAVAWRWVDLPVRGWLTCRMKRLQQIEQRQLVT